MDFRFRKHVSLTVFYTLTFNLLPFPRFGKVFWVGVNDKLECWVVFVIHIINAWLRGLLVRVFFRLLALLTHYMFPFRRNDKIRWASRLKNCGVFLLNSILWRISDCVIHRKFRYTRLFLSVKRRLSLSNSLIALFYHNLRPKFLTVFGLPSFWDSFFWFWDIFRVLKRSHGRHKSHIPRCFIKSFCKAHILAGVFVYLEWFITASKLVFICLCLLAAFTFKSHWLIRCFLLIFFRENIYTSGVLVKRMVWRDVIRDLVLHSKSSGYRTDSRTFIYINENILLRTLLLMWSIHLFLFI